MRIAVIDTGLFPDRESVEVALERLGEEHQVQRFDVRGQGIGETLWDAVLEAVLGADRAVTL